VFVVLAVCSCGTSVSPAQRHAADLQIAKERADRIGTLLHGWQVFTIPSKSLPNSSCHFPVGGGAVPTVKREYDYPPTGSLRLQVSFSVNVFPSASLAPKWIEVAQGPRGRECVRAATQRLWERTLKRPVRVVAIPGPPKWLHVPHVHFLHGYSLVISSRGRYLVGTKAEFQDRHNPRVAYDIWVIGFERVPRALAVRVVDVAGA
jgi:hypothetical protein